MVNIKKRVINIKVPCSTANLGPGFDVLGMALSLFLSVEIHVPGSDPSSTTFSYRSTVDNIHVPNSVPDNLITRVAAYVAAAHGATLPKSMHIKIENEIPLGRGLGSSGTAVVAGVLMGNAVCNLNLSQDRLLDFCNFIEGHPDNTTASLIGGFTASYLSSILETAFSDVILENDSVKFNPNNLPPVIPSLPVTPLGRYIRLGLASNIRAVVVIPAFELQTKLSREVLPISYSRADVVFNLQRLGVLTTALGQENPDADLISEAMQDCLHQKYRQHLIPGLSEILALNPSKLPGLLGVCMSGAGPTVLAFATNNFEEIGEAMIEIFLRNVGSDGLPIQSCMKILDIVRDGTEFSEEI
ncbi:hypothetical protein HK096_004094, partial [Nowakowskiella sp. JEL0078]